MSPFPSAMIPQLARPAALRRELRARRRALSVPEQRRHALALARRLGRHPAFLRARRIGIYWPADGELDPRPLLELPQSRGKRWQLPVLWPHPHPRLWFLGYRPGAPMRPNRFGIPEPARRNRRLRLAWTLDLLLVPLVGFDTECNRLGMGGGYYDRTLGYLAHRHHWRRPHLIGIAHECQRVARLPVRPWDVPLDLVVTERRVYRRGGPPWGTAPPRPPGNAGCRADPPVAEAMRPRRAAIPQQESGPRQTRKARGGRWRHNTAVSRPDE